MPKKPASWVRLRALLFALTIAACSGIDPTVSQQIGGASDGGDPGVGGATATAGGVPALGGARSTGGSANGGSATGGLLGSGGAQPTGGAVASGGSPAAGGSLSSTGGANGTCSTDGECPNGHCVSGSCVCWDAASIYCTGQCTPIQWDNNNCGGCNRVCPGTAPRCNAGTCVCDSPPCGSAGSGGASATGGAAATGGAPATGGTPATGGDSPTGGSAPTGGTPATGGAPTGGTPATGGAPTGGTSATGGAKTGGAPSTGGSPTGGSPATGGAPTGGTSATGGAKTGGAPSTGGSPTGGTAATGGAKTGGAPSTGGAATGGASAGGSCGLWTSPSPNTASFTWYYFGQGTSQTNGKYQTACGYLGTESGQTDSVSNIVNPNYFAAIPGSNNFNTVDHCGACIKITNGSKSIVATIIDECPTDNGSNAPCLSAGHLDLSWKAWSDLGYNVGNPSNTTWAYVPCGITSGIVVRFKSNNNNQEIYIENVNIPVKSVTSSTVGTASRMGYGTWHFNSPLNANSTLTLTATNGAVVTITITSTAADTDVHYSQQFPACSG